MLNNDLNQENISKSELSPKHQKNENDINKKDKAAMGAEISDNYLQGLDFQLETEEQIIEEFAKHKSPGLRESLLSVRKSGEDTLKNISSKVVELFNSNKQVIYLRDKYIEKRARKTYQELSVENNLAQAHDYDSFLKTISSDFWGTSSNAGYAVEQTDQAIKKILERFPEKREEIMEIWPKLLSRTSAVDTVTQSLNAFLNKSTENIKDNLDSVSDFEAISYLSKLRAVDNPEMHNQSILKIDSLISNFSNVKSLPENIRDFIFGFFIKRPDELLADSRRIDFVFQLWRERHLIGGVRMISQFHDLLPIMMERLKTCSEDEIKDVFKILHNLSNQYQNYNDFNWLLDCLPLNNKQLQKFKAIKEGSADNCILSLKKAKVSGQTISDDDFQLILNNVNGYAHRNEKNVIFLADLITNYPDISCGLNEGRIIQLLDAFNGKEMLSFDELHILTEIMNQHQWPDELKKRIFALNNIYGNSINEIIHNIDDPNYSWIKEDPLLYNQLELDFNRRAERNDLRHYFYEVIDGIKTSDNFEELLKSYAASKRYLNFEEFRSLFFDKGVDKKYLQYFINKINISDIIENINNGVINGDDISIILESAVIHGQADDTYYALNQLFGLESFDNPEKRRKVLEAIPDNIIGTVNRMSNAPYGIKGWLASFSKYIFSNDENLSNISPEENIFLIKNIINKTFDIKANDRLAVFALSNYNEMLRFFSYVDDEGESINQETLYLKQLFDRLLADHQNPEYSFVMRSYYSGLDSYFGDEECLEIERKFLEARALTSNDFIFNFNEMDDGQRQRFLDYFEENYVVDDNNTKKLSAGLRIKAPESFANGSFALKKVYLKLLNDKHLNSESANALFDEDIIFSDQDIKEAFFNNISNWPGVDGRMVLESIAKRRYSMSTNNDGAEADNFIVTPEEIKTISAATINNRGLSPRFWNGYLVSNGSDFYLDNDLFKSGLNNIGNDCFEEKPEDIVNFVESMKASKFEITQEDVNRIISGALSHDIDSQRLEIFHAYLPDVLEKTIIEQHQESNESLFLADINYSSEFKEAMLKYFFKNTGLQENIYSFIKYSKKRNDQEFLDRLKLYLANSSNDNYKTLTKIFLLKEDLLSVEEAKEFYREATNSSKDTPRAQILNSIDIIGSMLSNRANSGQLEKFLDNPRPEQISDLKEIADFIEKYNKESKGRTIVTMLFAREYFPERKIEEVIERVSGSLRKYQDVLDKNSYKNIPEGLRASIGMEYEITSSTAQGYEELTSRESLKSDIARLSEAARIGSGRDAVHEIATRPTDNPYLMILEMKLLHDIEYIDLNFDRSEKYQKGARGFHLTIGGEQGLTVNQESNFLQNVIIAASWGGVQTGETGHKVNGGRGVSLRGRSAGDSNNIQFFEKATNSVELRSLSIDKEETLQRAIETAFNGAIAIQAFKKCFPDGLKYINENIGKINWREILKNEAGVKEGEKTAEIALLWVDLINQITEIVKDHNESFLDREMFGYLDDQGVWVDTADFGGEYNRRRFESIINNIDSTVSLEEYVDSTKIDPESLFKSFDISLSDKIIKINNLYLKPGTTSSNNNEQNKSVFKGDHANAISMLQVTKIDNESPEYYGEEFLDNTIFDMGGEKRRGYYYLQGGSEKMLTHAVQKALLDFNKNIEKIVN